ncbi:MAG: HTH-type transcriptional repressor NicR [Alphaproteobacteria bacterium MarineAlpha11_Bin1]|nr:MAG: HTH-type transcriptional repressor NicR [Alphaproteobacteria bacterium MarineAlpha11_Bin1]|tara:strand:- start:26168 stop:26644 length:477 start_codon:yes stop_codon:yes gene_type:complete
MSLQTGGSVRKPASVGKYNELGYVLEEQVGHLLRRAHQRHSAIFQLTIGDDQLTPLQFAALMKLADVGKTSQNLLGRLTAMDAATMQGVIKRLSARGLIERRPDEVDRRRLMLSLSKAGRELASELSERGSDITNLTLDPLSESERETFLKLLHRLSS